METILLSNVVAKGVRNKYIYKNMSAMLGTKFCTKLKKKISITQYSNFKNI